MRISEMYHLDKSQYELDFIDVNPDHDIPLFLDPYYISKRDFPFAYEAHRMSAGTLKQATYGHFKTSHFMKIIWVYSSFLDLLFKR